MTKCYECGNRGVVGGCPSCHKTQEPNQPFASDGGPSEYYDFPEGAVTLNDLIEYKNMDFHTGNTFKACWRMGTKKGTTTTYDKKKIIYSGVRLLAKEVGVKEMKDYLQSLLDDPQFKEKL